MNKAEFATLAAALKTYYPKEGLLPNQQAMELWYMQLKDIPYKLAEVALNKWVATNKWSPSIAEIRESALSVANGDIPLWSDGWEQVLRAIRMHGSYNEAAALATMDEITAQTVKRLGWGELCHSENTMADRANFRLIFEQVAERKKQREVLPDELTNLIDGLRKEERQKLSDNMGLLIERLSL